MKNIKPYYLQHEELNRRYLSGFVIQYAGIVCAIGSFASEDMLTRVTAGITGAAIYTSGKLIKSILDKQQNKLIVHQVVNAVLDEREKESQLEQKTLQAQSKKLSEAESRYLSDSF